MKPQFINTTQTKISFDLPEIFGRIPDDDVLFKYEIKLSRTRPRTLLGCFANVVAVLNWRNVLTPVENYNLVRAAVDPAYYHSVDLPRDGVLQSIRFRFCDGRRLAHKLTFIGTHVEYGVVFSALAQSVYHFRIHRGCAYFSNPGRLELAAELETLETAMKFYAAHRT